MLLECSWVWHYGWKSLPQSSQRVNKNLQVYLFILAILYPILTMSITATILTKIAKIVFVLKSSLTSYYKQILRGDLFSLFTVGGEI